ncbi:transcription termination factor Tfs [Methanohalobium evestigatum Z-7303]|uniref:Transcription factor S n=1 Tax=Methanohalobium evestigatum (strain ATCC BAA-1072 / DSM 3721 / NBRC 107634 / OCM 161 / Z-7303) TaxID=644295 RepID=D7E957_METEZ|nr:transcription factor S [Methanohalobium evestigatum]ADI74005.1 transcription termination factor Tfs [Methanohalobium evestigatum Z-7303]
MEFCPKCKSLMFPVDNSMKCRKCGHIKGSGSSDTFVSRTEKENREVTVLEGEVDQGLPTTEAKCQECGHTVAYWWLRQLRSADESETRFFKCTKCGATWRDYD